MKRLQSLDALRGFDMFWIAGGGGIFAALATLTGWAPLVWWESQLHHVAWHGFTFEDMIFPLFLFIAGISFPFSMAKRMESGASQKSLYKQIVRRGLTLVLLGLVFNGLLNFAFMNIGSASETGFISFDLSKMRFASVLGRIGLAWMFAALIFINTRRINIRIIWCAGLLIFYWLLLTFVPAFDNLGAERFSMEGNFTSYFDRLFLPGRLYLGIHDPEGWLATIPAIGTAMLGMFTGQFIMWRKERLTELRRTAYMAIAGVALVGIGLLWNIIFPINKNLWTSSFVCYVGGLSLLLFSLFYLVIDVWGYRKWAFFFTVIGMNSITIYMAQRMIRFSYTSDFLFKGMMGWFPETWTPLLTSCGFLAVSWAFLYFLYKQKIFLKV
jgi:predicted acyltransferase